MSASVNLPPEDAPSKLTEFHLFPNLPTELRLKIWGIILSTPRVLHMRRNERVEHSRRIAESFASDEPPPAALHACHESRHEGLSIYKPVFKTNSSPKYTYTAFEHDTIEFSVSILEYIRAPELQCIQRMILEVGDLGYFKQFCMDILKKMKGLKELELVVWEKHHWCIAHCRGVLIRGFKEAKILDPGWECPKVKIVDQFNGEEVGLIPGGSIIPGWTG
ncbi:hypothetical protein LAWI1_G004631 [Lachnellula willkommii]|uniref:2EXR domain-containing protein n=1 Tax=Lachnellula willkommii TaxID=215461 RepID=A0A559M7M3_9HELO|nr:hypothetical protein LAWI1_G004631 [Lachnellula willkommii]